jgi:C-terminal processing protease CtpA/Prc
MFTSPILKIHYCSDISSLALKRQDTLDFLIIELISMRSHSVSENRLILGKRNRNRGLFLVLLLFLTFAQAQQPEKNIGDNRRYGLKMLKDIKTAIKEHYYDPTFHGVDLDARFQLAAQNVGQATSGGQVFGIIAQAVLDLNDSHTMFIPPMRGEVAVYGWRMQLVGDACYVTAIAKGTDAEAKGLKVGDRIVALDGYEPTRETMWKMYYYYYSLRPKKRVNVTAQSPSGETRQFEVQTVVHKITIRIESSWINYGEYSPDVEDELGPGPHYAEIGSDLIVCRLPSFQMESSEVDKMMKRISGHKTLILDLRGNPGGLVTALERFAGYFFDHEIKIADLKGRKDAKEMKSKPSKANGFTGKLFVLVNSQSASAAEVFARLVQLEKRGIVLGDHSSGSVMQGQHYEFMSGSEYDPIIYGLSITDADLIMSDGKSLEGSGVRPDELVLPTVADIVDGRDPVIARAAALAGVELTAQRAGDLFRPKEKKANQ